MASLKNLFTAKDLTQGAPWKRIVEFSIPLLIGNVVQQFYNTVDSIIVGMYIGDNALAAVGSAMPVLHLLLVRGHLCRRRDPSVAVLRGERPG